MREEEDVGKWREGWEEGGNPLFMGLSRGRGGGGRREKIGEDDGEGEEEKSLTGVSSKALITAYFLFLSGKVKICGEENLVLQEHSIVFLSPFYCRIHMPVIFAVFVNY